ncbi:MAG: hypothetical protein KA116_04120 [Proteobacteria bacterium]|nr:hypothetical protein [Pseudomonadota bacterium]
MKVHEWNNQINPEIKNSVENFKEKLAHSKILKSFENCAICEYKLFFHYVVDSQNNEVEEQVMCPSCNERGPTRKFKRH